MFSYSFLSYLSEKTLICSFDFPEESNSVNSLANSSAYVEVNETWLCKGFSITRIDPAIKYVISYWVSSAKESVVAFILSFCFFFLFQRMSSSVTLLLLL